MNLRAIITCLVALSLFGPAAAWSWPDEKPRVPVLADLPNPIGRS